MYEQAAPRLVHTTTATPFKPLIQKRKSIRIIYKVDGQCKNKSMGDNMDAASLDHLRRLRQELGVYIAGSLLFVGGAFFLFRQLWGETDVLKWSAAAACVLVYHFTYLWRHLADNRLTDPANAPLFPDLGLANGLTTVRAIFTAGLAGFLFVPWPEKLLAWVPGTLYLLIAGIDYLDGYTARITRRTTILGENLDMKWDGVGALIGGTLSVLYGQTPLPYLLVGFARYLYLFGLWVRVKRHQPVYELPPSRFRRAFAGTQMGFIGVVLLPVYHPPFTQIAAVLFMLPFLFAFLRDFLAVSGWDALSPAESNAVLDRHIVSIRKLFPLILRGVLAATLISFLWVPDGLVTLRAAIIVLVALAIPALLFGAAGRAVALILLLAAGIALQVDLLEWRFWLVLLFSSALLMFGTGPYSLWKPEDWLIYHRAGETR